MKAKSMNKRKKKLISIKNNMKTAKKKKNHTKNTNKKSTKTFL